MSANSESSSRVTEQLRLRKPRRNKDPILEKTDLNPQRIPSIIQSARCKSSASALLLSTCSGDNGNGSSSSGNSKKKNFAPGPLRGLGCAAASAQVSVPAAIRTSADWQAKKVRKKKQKKVNLTQNQNQTMGRGDNSSSSVVVVPDIWCGPGIGFGASDVAAAASVDCVVSRRPVVHVPVSGRAKVDGEKMNPREREREVFSFSFFLRCFYSILHYVYRQIC